MAYKPVSENIFESHIEGNLPVVVDFYADWNPAAKLLEKELFIVKAQVGERAAIVRMNIEENPFYKDKYDISAIPTMMIFHHGEIVWRKNGITTAHEILEQLNFHLV
ncbi:MAG TPA: thioredoxin family protein [Chitinophagaceae bacterium]|jgi:thioredoxin 1|nr:thioredoxin family protein [Chitinophagaceae bacterium]